MAEERFCIRLCHNDGNWMVFIFNTKEKARLVAQKITEERRAALEGSPRVIEFEDDSGYLCAVDAAAIRTMLCVGLFEANRVQIETTIAGLKAQMHMDAVVEGDPQLKTFLKMRRQLGGAMPSMAGGIVMPGGTQ